MRHFSSIVLVGLLVCSATHAQGLTAVRPLPGYVCMQLAISPEASVDPQVGVPILDAPSRSAATVSYAASVLIVQDPPQPLSGFRRVLLPSGGGGWIDARYLRPWSNPYAPTSRCVPSMMSNGKPGFGSK